MVKRAQRIEHKKSRRLRVLLFVVLLLLAYPLSFFVVFDVADYYVIHDNSEQAMKRIVKPTVVRGAADYHSPHSEWHALGPRPKVLFCPPQEYEHCEYYMEAQWPFVVYEPLIKIYLRSVNSGR